MLVDGIMEEGCPGKRSDWEAGPIPYTRVPQLVTFKRGQTHLTRGRSDCLVWWMKQSYSMIGHCSRLRSQRREASSRYGRGAGFGRKVFELSGLLHRETYRYTCNIARGIYYGTAGCLWYAYLQQMRPFDVFHRYIFFSNFKPWVSDVLKEQSVGQGY